MIRDLSKVVMHFSKRHRPAVAKPTFQVLSFDDDAACGKHHVVTTNFRSEVDCKRCADLARTDIYKNGEI